MPAGLQGKVAVVTGASRGVGKGIALGIAGAGATVYVTGRSMKERSSRFPGTMMRTAEEVAQRGGQGIAVHCDHGHDSQVESLFNRVREEQARLDVLVNNAFATPEEHLPMGILWSRLTRTEEVLSMPERYDPNQAVSALFNGRVAAALTADPNIMEKSGRSLRVAELADEYGLLDAD